MFLKKNDVGNLDIKFASLDICRAAERVSGSGTIVGCQLRQGLYRIYPNTRAARASLLITGLDVNGRSVVVYDKNPHVLREGASEEEPSTRVLIANVPISVSNKTSRQLW